MGKMSGMTVQERLEDISKRSGLSVEICRRVLNAESESIIESLKHGERATMSGRVTLRPEIRQRIVEGGKVASFIKVKAEVSSTLESAISSVSEFSKRPEETGKPRNELDELAEKGIRIRQISALQ